MLRLFFPSSYRKTRKSFRKKNTTKKQGAANTVTVLNTTLSYHKLPYLDSRRQQVTIAKSQKKA